MSISTVVGLLLEEVGGGVLLSDGVEPFTSAVEASDGRAPLEGEAFDFDELSPGPADVEPVRVAADGAALAGDGVFASVERLAVLFSSALGLLSTAGFCRSHFGSACFTSDFRNSSETSSAVR
jgi:hypothetical protein